MPLNVKYFSCIVTEDKQIYWSLTDDSSNYLVNLANSTRANEIKSLSDYVVIDIINLGKLDSKHKKDWDISLASNKTIPLWFELNDYELKELAWKTWTQIVNDNGEIFDSIEHMHFERAKENLITYFSKVTSFMRPRIKSSIIIDKLENKRVEIILNLKIRNEYQTSTVVSLNAFLNNSNILNAVMTGLIKHIFFYNHSESNDVDENYILFEYESLMQIHANDLIDKYRFIMR